MAELKPGPAPTGRDKIFDALYGAFGGKPENRWAADKLTTAIDWGTLGMLTGAYDGGRELAETGRPGTLAMALMPGAKPAQAAVKSGGAIARALSGEVPHTVVPEGIRAYHGSPHDFDKFDMSKIGTGEGAQAFGHGLYFAENEATAKSYRDQLTTRSAATPWARGSANDALKANDLLAKHGGDRAAAIAELERDIASAENSALPWGASLAEGNRKILGVLKSGNNKGHMYEVRINADPKDFLDWDKPLSQQGPLGEMAIAALPSQLRSVGPQSTPGHYAEVWRTHPNGPNFGGRVAEDHWKEAGIPGIKYLDQGSRSAGEGSHNYVLFDDALAEIVRKYGLLPPVVGAGLVGALQGQQPEAQQ